MVSFIVTRWELLLSCYARRYKKLHIRIAQLFNEFQFWLLYMIQDKTYLEVKKNKAVMEEILLFKHNAAIVF